MVMEAETPTVAEVRKKLQLASPGLCFGEVMTGMITIGSTEPVEGYHNEAAIGFRLDATVTVPNLPAFLKDPNHKGRWHAAGSIPVLGGRVESTGDGDFALFRRAILAEKGVREMVYDSAISVGGQMYLMRGRKYIEPSPPWRVWPATTTLYVQLFPLRGATGRPVGAGVLRLTLSAFIRQLLSMRVTGDFGLFDRCRHRLAFYRFFVTSLVNTYLKGRRW
jgi:hypothetical protein